MTFLRSLAKRVVSPLPSHAVFVLPKVLDETRVAALPKLQSPHREVSGGFQRHAPEVPHLFLKSFTRALLAHRADLIQVPFSLKSQVPLTSCRALLRFKTMARELPEVIDGVSECDGHAYRTPLMEAICHTDKQAIQLLLEAGADIDVTTKYYGTALHYAVSWIKWSGMPDVIELLVREHHANPNLKNQHGSTAFHELVLSEACTGRLIDVFLDGDGDPSARDPNQHTVEFLTAPRWKHLLSRREY